MQIIKLGLIIFSICFITSMIHTFILNNKEKSKKNTVRLPKGGLIAAVICFATFHLPLLAYFSTNDYSRIEMIIFFMISILVCSLIIASYANWRICYTKVYFEYRTVFRKKIQYDYADIISIRRLKSWGTIIRVKKRWLVIDPYALGVDEFLQEAYKKRAQ